MFKLDMDAIRRNARDPLLTAKAANPANSRPKLAGHPPKLAALAGLAVSNELAAEMLTARLIAAAMRACDHHGDSEKARADMRRDCMETPPHLRDDLLDHFRQTYPPT